MSTSGLSILPINHDNTDWMFLLLIGQLVYFLYARQVFEKPFRQIIRLPFNGNILKQVINDRNPLLNRSFYFFLLLFFSSAGLFTFLALKNYYTPSGKAVFFPFNFSFYAKITGCILLFYLAKAALFKASGTVLGSGKLINEYFFHWASVSIFTGIVLIPVNVFILYFKYGYPSQFIHFGLVFFCLAYLFHIGQGLMTGFRQKNISAFYLFLYLCTLEILPVLFLAKYLLNTFYPVFQ